MKPRVLFVDDEANILAALTRHFRNDHELLLAQSGEQALRMLETDGPVDVVVSDLRMPKMDGVKFLSEVRRLYPETVRIILTGHADLQNTLDAVNRCQAFRILAKPCPMEDIGQAIADAVDQARLVQDRRELAILRKVQEAMEGIIVGFTNLVEARDPYTAGHQAAVARLAVAVGEEMGLAPDQLMCIRMSGLVHDIGKVYVPTEFLNKPGKLSDLEFAIIKNHAQIGSEILKPIDFPWPIVRTVREHHERLDGSGYPQGLAADAISLEAKVIMVADTVDAMTSHRPYRPGLGLDKALAELRENKGKLYDVRVVDACLAFFEKAYAAPAPLAGRAAPENCRAGKDQTKPGETGR
jgi:putative two-component system response regulator